MKRHTIDDEGRLLLRRLFSTLVGLQLLGSFAPFARADIAVTGDTNPASAGFWTAGGDAGTDGTIGSAADGTLTADNGSMLRLDQGILGFDVDTMGTATFSGGAQWLLGNDLEVGHDGMGFLNLFSAASVTAGDDIYVGYNEGGEGTVVVDGDGSLLEAVDNLTVGDDGTGYLAVQNQASAAGGDVYIGGSATGSGTVLVTGSGSTLHSEGELWVGVAGHGSLTVQDGGMVTSSDVSLAYLGAESEGEILVEGEGSRWVNTGEFYIGDDGAGTAVVRDGGVIDTGTTVIGQYDGASGSLTVETTISDSAASFNVTGDLILANEQNTTGSLTVQGAGAEVSVTQDLKLGVGGDGALDILNGGAVTVLGSVLAGYTHYDADAGMDVPGTGNIVVSGTGSGLNVTNNLVVGHEAVGSLTIGDDASVSADYLIIGDLAGSAGTLIVENAGTYLELENNLVVASEGTGTATLRDDVLVVAAQTYVGDDDGSDGTLTIQNGAKLTTGDVNIASSAHVSASTGDVTVTGEDSLLLSSGDIVVGGGGIGSLTVGDAGTVAARNMTIGQSAGSTGTLIVEGAGTSLNLNGDLFVASEGTGMATIRDGAAVTADFLALAYISGSTGDLIVEGADTTLDLDYDLAIGSGGAGTATLRDGATVVSGQTYVGDDEGSQGTLNIQSGASLTTGGVNIASSAGEIASIGDVIVTGEGSLLASGDDIVVGGGGIGSLTVGDSGAVTAANLILASGSGSTGTLTVEGNATTVNLPGILFVGSGGTGTALFRDGATVTSDELYVGLSDGANGALTIESGASLTTGEVFIADESSSAGEITVTGVGSLLSGDASFIVGGSGDGILTVSDGGAVTGAQLTIGLEEGSSGTVSVAGAGSSLTVDGSFRIGDSGVGALTVFAGAEVSVGDTIIGSASSSAGSSLTVSGEGSRFSSGVNLTVGDAGSSTLNILDGGVVDVTGSVYMGDYIATAAVTIRGEGSTWSVGEEMNIGPSQTSTVNIYQGGTVSTGHDLNIGSQATFNVFVDGDGMIQTGTAGDPDEGDLNNQGQVHLVATASLAAGTYTPITVGEGRAFNGGGTYTAIGGGWNEVTHEFTVAEIVTNPVGALGGQRVQYDDGLVVSFAEGVGEVAFSVTAIDPGTIAGEAVLSAYTFDTTLADMPTGLSFLLTDMYSRESLNVWKYEGESVGWTAFDHDDFQVEGSTVSLLVSEFGDYAVTSLVAVPEPATWGAATGAAMLAFVAVRRRRRR